MATAEARFTTRSAAFSPPNNRQMGNRVGSETVLEQDM